MSKFALMIIVFFIILFFLYIPDLFPQCSCCGKKKFRFFFRIHKVVGISPGYRGCRSVCRKCCKKYDLKDLSDLDKLMSITRKLKIRRLSDDI